MWFNYSVMVLVAKPQKIPIANGFADDVIDEHKKYTSTSLPIKMRDDPTFNYQCMWIQLISFLRAVAERLGNSQAHGMAEDSIMA